MRVTPAADCSTNQNFYGIRAIVRYQHADHSLDPESTGYPTSTDCIDEVDLVPVVQRNVGDLAFGEEVDIGFFQSSQIFRFTINDSSLVVNWNNPTLLRLENKVPTFSPSDNALLLNGTAQTVRFLNDVTDLL